MISCFSLNCRQGDVEREGKREWERESDGVSGDLLLWLLSFTTLVLLQTGKYMKRTSKSCKTTTAKAKPQMLCCNKMKPSDMFLGSHKIHIPLPDQLVHVTTTMTN